MGTKEALREAEERIARVCNAKGKRFIDATGFEGADASRQVEHAKRLGPSSILMKNTAVEENPVGQVARLHDLLK